MQENVSGVIASTPATENSEIMSGQQVSLEILLQAGWRRKGCGNTKTKINPKQLWFKDGKILIWYLDPGHCEIN